MGFDLIGDLHGEAPSLMLCSLTSATGRHLLGLHMMEIEPQYLLAISSIAERGSVKLLR